MIPKIPREFCIDSFEYEEYKGENNWSEPEYKKAITINNCRIDRSAEYTSTVAGKQLLYNAVIFCYNDITTPLPDFKTQSKIKYDNCNYIVTKIIINYYPYEKKIFSYELEVV